MPKPFDAASKELFQRYPRDWLALFGWPAPADDAGLTVVDSDLSTVSATADKLVRVDEVAVPYIAHVEFQSSGDRAFDGRMLVYNVLARRQHGLPVRSIAVLFRPAADAGPTGRFAEHLDGESWLTFAYHRLCLWELPTEALLDGPLGTVPLAPLTVDEGRVRGVLNAVHDRLQPAVSRGRLADMLECTRELLGLRFSGSQSELMMPTSLQKLIEEESWTYRQTVQKSLAEGRATGLAEGRAAAVIDQGTDKFGPPPPAVAERIAGLTDVETLRRLARRLLTAASWDEMMADA